VVLHKPRALLGLVVASIVPLTTPSPSPPPSAAPGAPASTEDAGPPRGPPPCPDGMVHVRGDACDEVEESCKRWLDPPPYQNLRCAEFAPTRCKGPRRPLDFCIDREEAHDADTLLPVVNVSFVAATKACEARGLSLCTEPEWVFACEGEAMLPYPYGLSRDSSACNIDQRNLGGKDGKLRDLRAKVTEFPRCTSPFGVHHMTGNVDEWVHRTKGPQRSVLHGGWWLPGRNRCRATTAEHGPEYSGSQVGYRCCGPRRPSP
jgi:sulfatase modifying factor 1